MKADIVILGSVAAILGILFLNSSSVAGFAEPVTPQVPPNVIQVIIEALQRQEPWLQPVETIYVTPKSGAQSGITYDARLLFLDTRGFFGVQYDVTAGVSPEGAVQILGQFVRAQGGVRLGHGCLLNRLGHCPRPRDISRE